MWCIYFLLSAALLSYMMLVTLAYGVRINMRTDFDNLSVCVRAYVFGWIEIASLNVFVCEGKFYYSINRGDFKTLGAKIRRTARDKANDGKVSKTDYAGLFKNAIKDFPEITLKDAYVQYSVDYEDRMKNSLFGGVVNLFSGMLKRTVYSKVSIDSFTSEDTSAKSDFRGVIINAVTGFSAVKILFYLLHIISLKRKFTRVESV